MGINAAIGDLKYVINHWYIVTNNKTYSNAEIEEFGGYLARAYEEIINAGVAIIGVNKTAKSIFIKLRDKSGRILKFNVKNSKPKGAIKNPKGIPNMSKGKILNNLPKGWKYTEVKGFVHLFDENGNPLDINVTLLVKRVQMLIYHINRKRVRVMICKEIQEKIDDLYYWDSRVIKLECNYFGDEVILIYDDEDGDVTYHFKECYNVLFNHDSENKKDQPVRELVPKQLPYFLQDVEVTQNIGELYDCKINMPPLEISIKCKTIEVTKVNK